MELFHRYKKTALLISSILFGAFFLHLVGGYVYSQGKFVGLPGGSISIAIVWDAPDVMNPLTYWTGQVEDLMFNFLFRSLIRYDSNQEIYVWDLGNCDLSNLTKVTCTLRENAKWSDNSDITAQDIVATINAFRRNAVNTQMKNFLKNVTIEATGTGQVTLTTNESSPYMIEALAYPIIRSDVIDQIENNRFKKENYVSSGPFIFSEVFDDTEYGFHRVTFDKNPYSTKEVWLDRLSFKFFNNVPALEKGIDTTTVIIPPRAQENIKTTARFKDIHYTAYEFFWLFFHTDKMKKDVRNLLHQILGNAFKNSTPVIERHKPLQSIFLDEKLAIIANNTGTLNIDEIMEKNGYKKKWVLLAEAKNIPTTETTEVEYPKMQYFTNGNGNAILYSDAPDASITIRGKVPSGTQSVKINDYTLQQFNPGDTSFIYRASMENGAIQNGKNTYNLSLAQANGDTLSETLTIYQTTDEAEMQNYKNTVENQLREKMNTPEKIAEREKIKQEKIAAIEKLSDGLYYNDKYEPYSLSIAYLGGQMELETYANFIQDELRKIGILLSKKALTAEDIKSMVASGEKDYDMILIGIETPGNIARIGKTFLSSEAGKGINFSNIQSKNFDKLFEELRNATDQEKAKEIQQKIVNYMNEMSFFLPISSPIHSVYVDRNIKGVVLPKVIPDISNFAYIFDKVSIKDTYNFSLKDKSVSGFFNWIWSHF